MTEHELDAAMKAFQHALKVGAPRISTLTRDAIARSAVMRLRHQFNVPAPKLVVVTDNVTGQGLIESLTPTQIREATTGDLGPSQEIGMIDNGQ